MWASLLLETLPWFASGGMGALGWYMRGAMLKPKPSVKGLSLMEVMEKGNSVVAQMAADVHKLYHPPGEDGKPCACAMCEIRADDDPQPEPVPEPEPSRELSPDFVDALKKKLDGLRKENAELRKGSGQRVVTKVQERKTPLQLQIEQAAAMVDDKPVMVNFEPSDMTNGYPMHVVIAPKVEPDYQIEQFGGGIVRSHYPKQPQSGPGSEELGIMDRAIGTIGHKCNRCGDTAWKYGRLGPDFRQQYLCKKCWGDEYRRPTSDVTSIRQENGRKYVCYRDGHCEVT